LQPTFGDSGQALVDLYTATAGPQWTNNNNWLVGDPCANRWFGVGCNSNGTVTDLYDSTRDEPHQLVVCFSDL